MILVSPDPSVDAMGRATPDYIAQCYQVWLLANCSITVLLLPHAIKLVSDDQA